MPLDVPGLTRAKLSAAASRLGLLLAGKLDLAKALAVWAMHWIRLPEIGLFRAIRTVPRHGLGPLDVLPERSNRYLKEQKSWLLDLGNKEASSSLPLINWNNPNAKPWILMAQSCDPQIPRKTLALKEGIPCIHCPALSVHVPMKWVNELTIWPARTHALKKVYPLFSAQVPPDSRVSVVPLLLCRWDYWMFMALSLDPRDPCTE